MQLPQTFINEYGNELLTNDFFDLIEQKLGKMTRILFHNQVEDDLSIGMLSNGNTVYFFYSEIMGKSHLDDEPKDIPHIGEADPTLRDFVAHGYADDNVYFESTFSINDGPVSLIQYLQLHNQYELEKKED